MNLLLAILLNLSIPTMSVGIYFADQLIVRSQCNVYDDELSQFEKDREHKNKLLLEEKIKKQLEEEARKEFDKHMAKHDEMNKLMISLEENMHEMDFLHLEEKYWDQYFQNKYIDSDEQKVYKQKQEKLLYDTNKIVSDYENYQNYFKNQKLSFKFSELIKTWNSKITPLYKWWLKKFEVGQKHSDFKTILEKEKNIIMNHFYACNYVFWRSVSENLYDILKIIEQQKPECITKFVMDNVISAKFCKTQ